MQAVWINTATIIIGGLLGLLFKRFITDRMSRSIETALGLCTFCLAVKMALNYNSVLMMIGCVTVGGLIGTAIQFEHRVNLLAQSIQNRFRASSESKFAEGLSFTSILFCTGAMAVVGSINAGVSQDYEILFTKSMLDGFFNMTMGAVYGVGVIFSAIPVLLYQGSIAIGASKLTFLNHPEVIKDISGVGGILVAMIGLNIMKIKTTPVGDYLPAMLLVMVFAPLWYLWW